jgi:hypothetical protein
MSLFKNVTLPCPACGEETPFDAVASVNADRRPDFREAILDGSFQRQACGKCGKTFRLEPAMTYLDSGRGQWIAAHPFNAIGEWEALEKQTRAAFDRGYGEKASAPARKLGANLKPRLVFGWGALREKVFAAEQQLSDVDLELTKIAVLRNSGQTPLSSETELRLVSVEGDQLIMAWVLAQMEEVVEKLKVPRDLFAEIAANRAGWQPLRDELSGGLFVDMQRLMLPVA